MALSSYQAGYELTFEPVRYPNNNPTLGSGTGRNRTFSKFVHYPRKGDVHEHHHACQRMWAPVLIMYIVFFFPSRLVRSSTVFRFFCTQLSFSKRSRVSQGCGVFVPHLDNYCCGAPLFPALLFALDHIIPHSYGISSNGHYHTHVWPGGLGCLRSHISQSGCVRWPCCICLTYAGHPYLPLLESIRVEPGG